MSEKITDTGDIALDRKDYDDPIPDEESSKETIEKDFIPNFFPTYRIKTNLYPIPIIIVVICAGLLAYTTYILAGIDNIEGGAVSEREYGVVAGIANGIIFTIIAVISAFIIIFFVKRYGIGILRYLFGFNFGFVSFFLTWFFGSIILVLILIHFLPGDVIILIIDIIFPIVILSFSIVLIYLYFTSDSIYLKNFLVIYIGLLIGAIMGVIMFLWTTLAILIGVSLWDIYAVKAKRGPIKEMIDIASQNPNEDALSDEDLREKVKGGEMEYDTSKLEIGIGDLAFYSMLTSSALIRTGSIIVMILTAIAIIIGTGITITGLKRNKLLPGLPISIFLGIGTMLISWYIIITFFP